MQHPTLSTMFRQLNEQPQLPEQTKCPTCESSNTKFCYYNNYNLSQPRYFCKSCRRYWTKESTLRNVPVAMKAAVDAGPSGPDHDPIRVPAPDSGASAGVGSGFSIGSMVSPGQKFGYVFDRPFQLGSGFSFGSMMSSGRKFGLGDVFYGLGHLGGRLIKDNSGSGVGRNRRAEDGDDDGDEKMEDGGDDGDEKMEERLGSA